MHPNKVPEWSQCKTLRITHWRLSKICSLNIIRDARKRSPTKSWISVALCLRLHMNNNTNQGIIIRIAGPVVDVRFAKSLPFIHEALEIELKGQKKLILEVAFSTGNNEVKTLAMGTTDTLCRGMKVKRTNSPIKVPVGLPTLGRIFRVIPFLPEWEKEPEKETIYDWK